MEKRRDVLFVTLFTTDEWSDPNQTSFMAVTAHWIEATDEKTPTGVKKKFQLRADLIRFHKLPGRHMGKHLAHSLQIAFKSHQK
jgi:hypothetical protein